jgi:hypothetical protein
MTALSIDKAIRLYHKLEYFIPSSIAPDTSVLKFIAEIVYNIKTTNNHRVYLEALALMQDTTIKNIVETYTPEESLSEFSNGLQENQILALKEFCNRVGI